jgi:hypothetical protein
MEITGALISPGRRYTADGAAEQAVALKHRELGENRVIPLAPYLVAALTEHRRRFVRGPHEPLFTDASGALIPQKEIYRVWGLMKDRVFADRPGLRADLDLYDLRHARLSHWLATGQIPRSTIAAWAGNSVPTLEKTYEGVVDAASGTWSRDLERYFDEIVPPHFERQDRNAADRQQRVVDLALRLSQGEQSVLRELMDAIGGPQPGSRTAAHPWAPNDRIHPCSAPAQCVCPGTAVPGTTRCATARSATPPASC